MANSAVLDYTNLMVSTPVELCIVAYIFQALVWTLWTVALILTVLRGITRWYSQGRIFVDDYFVFFGMLTLTGLSAVITRVLPQFYLTGEYYAAVMKDPTAPLPLPPDEFFARTRTALKLLFSHMLLFWTTIWAGNYIRLRDMYRSRLMACSEILYSFLLPSSIGRITEIHQSVVGLFHRGYAVISGMHTLQLSDLQARDEVLELWCVRSFTNCSIPTDHLVAGCGTPEDIRRADASIKFATIADVVADVIIMILPLNLLRRLQVSTQQKFGLAVIFSLGTIIIAFAFARLGQVSKATSKMAKNPSTVADGPVLLSMWSHIESSVSIVVATLPAFRYLLNGKLGRTQGISNPPHEHSGRKIASDVAARIRTMRSLSDQWHGSANKSMATQNKSSIADNDWGSEIELRPNAGIEKRVDYTFESAPGSSAGDAWNEPT